VGYTWQELGEFIASKCRGPAEILSTRVKWGEPAKLLLLVRAGPSFIELEREVRIEFEQALCDECYRSRSGYYEAILQLRGSAERVERVRRKLVGALERRTFIAREEELKGGVNLYAGSRSALQQALAEFGYSIKPSFKLAGMRQGKRIYRATYLIRV